MKVGDKVKFIEGEGYTNGSIEEYYYQSHGIPENLITHGHTYVDMDRYEKEGGIITGIYEEYFIVKYPTDNQERYTALGFKAYQLKLISVNNWRERANE